jgi:hypothetical protein
MHVFRDLMRFVDQMSMQEWLLVLAGVIVIGLVCMRGFGSRKDY